MNIEQVKAIIEFLPHIVLYVVPGYIFLWVYAFMFSKNIEEDKHAIVKSIVLSFFIITLFRSMGFEVDFSPWIVLSLIVVAMLGGFLYCKVCSCNKIYRLFMRTGINKSLHGNMWNDLVDLEHGLWLRVYLSNEKVIYLGKLKRYEETTTDKTLLILSSFITYKYNSDEMENYKDSPEKMVAINTKDISRIELFYDKKSKKAAS